MLQAFVDDSSSDVGDTRLVLAGYIHKIAHWKNFSDDWHDTLEELPRLASLHMTTSFRGWSREERHRKLKRLAEVLAYYKPLSLECSISRRDFKQILQPHAPYDFRNPYAYCFHTFCVKAAQLAQKAGLQGPLDFVFDEQGNVGLDAATWYPIFKQLQGPDIAGILGGPPIFRDDEAVLPLQAADMLAWHLRRLREPKCDDPDREIAQSIVFLHHAVDVPRKSLEDWAAAFSKTPGIVAVHHRSGSVKHSVADVIRAVEPEKLIPTMNAIARHGRRMHYVKTVLERFGLRRVWKWLSKRKVTFR